MALQTHLAVGLVSEITGLEVARVWSYLAAAVAADANISRWMAGLAGLQVSAGFNAVICCPVLLAFRPQRIV